VVGTNWRQLSAPTLAARLPKIHTPSMSLKSAALLALVGTSLLTFVLLAGLIGNGWGLLDGVVPLVRFVTSLIRALAGASVVVFFYVFHKAQR
jgi:hypothetical protein